MALSSMTGFGRARGTLSDRFSASVVVRSVNHRYLDVQVRTNLREELPELEATVRTVVAEPLERGRVTVQVDLERTATGDARAVVDSDILVSMAEQLDRLELPERMSGSISLGDLIAVPGVVSVMGEQTALDGSETEALRDITRNAVDQYLMMRREEGQRLVEQVVKDLDILERFLTWFEPQMDSFRDRILERLRERLDRLLDRGAGIEPERMLQEAAIVADRSDVSEEVVRLHSHLDSFRDRLGEGGAVGRALDFLCQEIHRELTTLGSKCREVGVGERLVDAKAATERMREQVQNLE
jgi:uncharacterized protein (TIGR00255 family)